MRSVTRIAIVATVLASALSGMASAESLTAPTPPGRVVYPYKDLPGVTAPHPAVDDGIKCHTALAHPRWWGGIFYRGLPQLVYVCEQNGVVSSSTRPPNRAYWQYNDPNR